MPDEKIAEREKAKAEAEARWEKIVARGKRAKIEAEDRWSSCPALHKPLADIDMTVSYVFDQFVRGQVSASMALSTIELTLGRAVPAPRPVAVIRAAIRGVTQESDLLALQAELADAIARPHPRQYAAVARRANKTVRAIGH